MHAKAVIQSSDDPRSVALFDREEAPHVWRNPKIFNKENYDAYFELLSKFELVFWLDRASKYLVPSLLPESQRNPLKASKEVHLAMKKRSIRFSSIFPIGLFHRLMIQLLQVYSNSDSFSDCHFWRTGLNLIWSQGHVSIYEEPLQLIIEVKGKVLSQWIDTKMEEVLQVAKRLISTNFPGEYLPTVDLECQEAKQST